MSDFITKDDYRSTIKTYRLDQLLADESHSPENIMADAEEEAIAVVRDALVAYYDVDTIFAQVGSARAKNVLRWTRCLALYFMFQRVPDDLVPERVVKDYDDCMEMLDAISDGKRSVDLPPKLDDEENAVTKYKWGSRPARSHGDE